ncbi:MAG: helical backbone metal receptor [Candidatus Odinarchaeota archaeon]
MLVYDDVGNRYNPDEIETIVSLVPSISETIYTLSGADYLIGITDFCISPGDLVDHPGIFKVGGVKNPDLDRIIELKPDLCIVNVEENRKVDAEKLSDAGIPLFVTEIATVIEARGLVQKIGYLCNRGQQASLIVSMIDQVLEETMASEQGLRVFVPLWYNPWMTFSDITYAGSLILTCGGINVFGNKEEEEASNYFEIEDDSLLAADIDLILLPDEPFAFKQKHVHELEKLGVRAAREGRFHFLDGRYLFWYGIRTLQSLPIVSTLLRTI